MQKNCLNYPVEFVEDAFGESSPLAKLLETVTGSDEPRVMLIADANVVQRTDGLGSLIGRYVNANGIHLAGNPIVLSGGEKIKADNFQSAIKVMNAVLDAKLGVEDCILALGGGSLLDIAGYAAAQVRGGVRLVRMPTTPAAMIDAAFSEYAAINSINVKDALRIPCVPAAVVIDTSFAKTVLDGVWRGGFSEAVRIAAVSDAPFMRKLAKLATDYRDRKRDALLEIVNGAFKVRCKKGVTDFAHWAAMRLESMSGYKLPHGYAVAIGICIDSAYAVERGVMKASDRELVCGALLECGALDGLSHSKHILSQPENVLFGLDAWKLSSGSESIVIPSGIGKSEEETSPDRELFSKVLKEFAAVATEQ